MDAQFTSSRQMGILKAISKLCSSSLSDLYRLKKIQLPSSLAREGCEKVIRKSDRYRPTFQLCRYITRLAIANERLKLNGAGDVVLQLKAHTRTGPNTSSYRRWISYNGWSTYGLFSQQLKISKQTLACVALLTGFGRLLPMVTQHRLSEVNNNRPKYSDVSDRPFCGHSSS